MRLTYLLGIIVVAATAFAACSNKEEHGASDQAHPSPAAPAAQAAVQADPVAARAEFVSRCAPCHGEQGKGNGPASAALNPKPRDYTNSAWQKTVTDDDIKKTILMGGAAVGKSPIMPASPDLDSKPEVLAGIVAIVRGFDGK